TSRQSICLYQQPCNIYCNRWYNLLLDNRLWSGIDCNTYSQCYLFGACKKPEKLPGFSNSFSFSMAATRYRNHTDCGKYMRKRKCEFDCKWRILLHLGAV